MAKKKQVWNVGDIFLIKLKEDSYVVGQIVGQEPRALNSVSIALFDEQTDVPKDVMSLKLDIASIFSILFSTRGSLDSGDWKVIGNRPVALPRASLPYESLRSSGFIGAKIQGSNVIDEFVGAYYGLTPWDDFHDPNYLDKLLVLPSKKPSRLIFNAER